MDGFFLPNSEVRCVIELRSLLEMHISPSPHNSKTFGRMYSVNSLIKSLYFSIISNTLLNIKFLVLMLRVSGFLSPRIYLSHIKYVIRCTSNFVLSEISFSAKSIFACF